MAETAQNAEMHQVQPVSVREFGSMTRAELQAYMQKLPPDARQAFYLTANSKFSELPADERRKVYEVRAEKLRAIPKKTIAEKIELIQVENYAFSAKLLKKEPAFIKTMRSKLNAGMAKRFNLKSPYLMP